MTPRLAIVVSHPIPYFTPWYRAVHVGGGIDVRVFFGCDWGVERYNDPEFGVSIAWDTPLLEGYPHEFLPIARRPTRMGFWELDNPRVGEALDRFKPDVVQVYGYARRTNWRVVRWARRHRVPVLLYSDSSVLTRRSLWRQAVNEIAVRQFYRYVDGAFYVGDTNYAFHRQYRLPPDRLFPGTFPVDADALARSVPDRDAARRTIRAQWNIPDDAFVALFCGKYVPRKRPMDLVRAAGDSARRCHRRKVWALLVGEGPERATIERYCRDNDVANVALTGFVNQTQVAAYYAAADVLTVTSSRDAHPLVVTEAIGFSLPVIVSDQTGCVGERDVARRGINALVFPTGDVRALVEAIDHLCSDSAIHARMSLASYELSRDHTPAVAAALLKDATNGLSNVGKRHPASWLSMLEATR